MRMEPFLPKRIPPDQTAFIKGRCIGQNIRLLNDLMSYTESNKISGIFLSVDFEKAFDSLEWEFLHSALKAFNFGPAITKWITILYNDVEIGVMNGGYMTNYFKTTRRVLKDCPLSPFLFILSVELLALKLRYIPECKGISLPNSQEVKLSQFADDTTLILSDIDSLKASLHHINTSGEISGLKLNVTKTKPMWIGSKKECKNKIMNFASRREPIKVLGAYISYDQQKTNEANLFLAELKK